MRALPFMVQRPADGHEATLCVGTSWRVAQHLRRGEESSHRTADAMVNENGACFRGIPECRQRNANGVTGT